MATTTETIISANELLARHSALILKIKSSQQLHKQQLQSLHSPPLELLKLPLLPSPSPSPSPEHSLPPSPIVTQQHLRKADLPPAKLARVARYRNYVSEEETIRNDYSQRYVDGGEWPQNWVLGAEPEHRFEEYPKQQRLLSLKKASVNSHSLPPSYLFYSELNSLHPCKFDVILLDPPFSSSFTWDHLQELPIPSLAADPSFVFLWVGSGAGGGLERGREVLAKWGYRRCEDVVWVKTNKTTNQGPGTDPPTTSLLTRTKQHCLIGIRGTVRRSTDSWFVHCNVDTDVIIWEGDPSDPTRKPPEMYTLIENFCLGTRRLEIFGRPSSLRRGWVTALGPGQEQHMPTTDDGDVHVEGEEGGYATKWRQTAWEDGIKEMSNGGKPVVAMTQEIDNLRPKSPFRSGQIMPQSGPTTGGVALSTANKFGSGSRGGFSNNTPTNSQGKMMGQNQLMVQPMMGMGMHQMGMGMGPPVGMDEMMNGWNPMMNNMGGVGIGMGGIPNAGMGNVGMGLNMMNQLSMPANNYQAPPPGFGSGVHMLMGGAPMGWGEQPQFGMEGWDGEGMMGMVGPGIVGMPMNGMGLPGQWNNGAMNFDGYH